MSSLSILMLIFAFLSVIGSFLKNNLVIIGVLGYIVLTVLMIYTSLESSDKLQNLCNSTCEPLSVKACTQDYVICGDKELHWF